MGNDGLQNQASKRNKSRWWFIGAVGVFLLTKGKSLITLLKFSKFGFTFLSMLLTVGAYAVVFPLPFAVGVVLMIFIHELGHVAAAKIKGLKVTAPVFIPFLGAFIMMKRNPRDAVTEAFIAYGGPLVGSLAAFLALGIGLYWEIPWLIVVSYVGCFLNAINLLPIHPLDGGRISTAVTRWLWLVGLVGGLVVILYLRSVLFFILWALFAWELYQKYVRRRVKERSTAGTFEIPLAEIEQPLIFLPGEDHQRELPFTTYSTLEGEQKVEFDWEMIGLHGSAALPEQGLVRRVKVVKVQHMPKDAPEKLVVHCLIDYVVHENDRYYDVPPAVRWKFGFAYAVLAAALITAMIQIQQLDLQRYLPY